MASVYDVAQYIVEHKGNMPAMKLQKLVYYSQAWSLVWDEKPLFPEVIEAWANGPVSPHLYDIHRGMFEVGKGTFKPYGDGSNLSKVQKETVDAVLAEYGEKPAYWLSELTHNEAPWKDARQGLPLGARGNTAIEHASMAEYYSSL
jgi:uncharacterized phage-associated protein